MSDAEFDFEEQFIRRISRDIERRIIRHLNRIEDELEIMNRICDKNRKNIADLVNRMEDVEGDILRFNNLLAERGGISELELKEIPVEDAKIIIYDYLRKNPGATTSDVFIGLEIKPEIVINSLEELLKENKIRGEDIE